jgi:hypothetical protein
LQVRLSARRRAARLTGKCFDAICINISKIYQEIAAVMVTVRATQCMTRAKRKKNAITVIWPPALSQYDFGKPGRVAARLSLKPRALTRGRACD